MYIFTNLCQMFVLAISMQGGNYVVENFPTKIAKEKAKKYGTGGKNRKSQKFPINFFRSSKFPLHLYIAIHSCHLHHLFIHFQAFTNYFKNFTHVNMTPFLGLGTRLSDTLCTEGIRLVICQLLQYFMVGGIPFMPVTDPVC